MKKSCIYPGTFDPITNGHLDVIIRATKIFDKVIVAVAKSDSKQPMFAHEKRIEMAKEAVCELKNVAFLALITYLLILLNRTA